MSPGTLANKIAVVSGASRGIGASVAKHLAASGATVVVNYADNEAAANETVAEIESLGGSAWAARANFSVTSEITRLFGEIRNKHGRVDILVNNAAVFVQAKLENITTEEFHRLFNLNVLGLLWATKEAVALMGEGGGSVINIGAISGKMGAPGISMYAATKGAVDTITVSLSKELGPRKIRVNALNPGLVQTDGTAAIRNTPFEAEAIRWTPLGRAGRPDDIARVAAFIASSDAGWVTGQLINLAGGQTH